MEEYRGGTQCERLLEVILNRVLSSSSMISLNAARMPNRMGW